MSATNAIELSGVTKRYGRSSVLDNVSFALSPGERVALIGHNGAGKTTVMKLILGLTKPQSGSVRVGGENPAGPRGVQMRRALGYLPENVAFQGAASGRATLRFYARLKGEQPARVDALLEEVGLADAARRAVNTYSKGMRQRLGLAQALLGAPSVLILDEPTTGLDPTLRHEFHERLAELHRRGTTILISSHSLLEIEGRTDRIAVMNRGRMVALGTLDELRELAGVPVRIRLSVASGTGPQVATHFDGARHVQHVNDRHVDLACLAGEKMALLRQVAGAGAAIEDVSVSAPPLDEIYQHFTHGGGAG